MAIPVFPETSILIRILIQGYMNRKAVCPEPRMPGLPGILLLPGIPLRIISGTVL
jgi:hypothetical protein